MGKASAYVAALLAVILCSSVTLASSAFAFGLSQPLSNFGSSSGSNLYADDNEDEDEKQKVGDNHESNGEDSQDHGQASAKVNSEDDHHKGKKIVITSKHGGRGDLSESDDDDEQEDNAKTRSINDNDSSGVHVFPADFTIEGGNGIAVAKGEGKGGLNARSLSLEVSLDLDATTVRVEGNHLRVAVDGTVTIGKEKYHLDGGQGIIIFFDDHDKKLFRGIMHITGDLTNNGGQSEKFHLRAFLLPPFNIKSANTNSDDSWQFVVQPAIKIGPKIRVILLAGTLAQLPSSPPITNTRVDHFDVNAPSSVTAGKFFNVTLTALDSDEKIVKDYKGKVNITDITGTVKPAIISGSDFVNGVFSGKLQVTKTMKADKLKVKDLTHVAVRGTSESFDVNAGSISKVILDPSSTIVKAGDKATFVAKPVDKFNNEIDASQFTFDWSLSSPDSGSISTSGNGANFTASSKVTSEENVTLTVAIGSLLDSAKITIKPKSPAVLLDHFSITHISSPKTAGSAFAISITAQTADGSTVTSYSGPVVINDTTGTLSITKDNGFAAGVWTGSVNITKAQHEIKIKVSDKATSAKSGTSNAFDVEAGELDHFDLNKISNQTAGVEFDFTVKAKDAYENTILDFDGNVTLSTNDGKSQYGNESQISPTAYTFDQDSDKGAHTFKAKLYNATTDAKISVESLDDVGKTGTSNKFEVRSAEVNKVSITPDDVVASLGQNVTFSSSATDAYGNVLDDVSYHWDLSSELLGSINSTSGDTVKFTASKITSVTLNGAITATIDSKTGTATIQVKVEP